MKSWLERHNEIVNVLRTHNGSTVKELALRFNVSEMTIRRDLHVLEDRRIVKTFHGSVVYNNEYDAGELDEDCSVDQARTRNIRQKLDIAKAAAKLVEDNDVLIIDIGSTAEALTRFLPREMQLTVLCYGLNILREVSRRPNTELIFAGGRYHDYTQMFESSQGIELIRSIRATKAFISAGGVNLRLGVTTAHSFECDTKRAVLESSLSRILIVDSSKFSIVQPSHFAEIDDFDVIITNRNTDKNDIESIRDRGIKVILA